MLIFISGDETLSVGATNQSLASLEIIESQLGDSESTKSPVVIVNHHQRNASLGSYSVKSQQSVTEVSLSSQAKTETKVRRIIYINLIGMLNFIYSKTCLDKHNKY